MRKKELISRILIPVMCISLAAAAIGCTSKTVATPASGSTSSSTSGSTSGSTSSAPSAAKSQGKKEIITIANNVAIKPDDNGKVRVIGTATNNDSVKHEFDVSVNFFDKDKKLIMTATGAEVSLGAGETSNFTVYGQGSLSKDVSSYKVQLGTIK